MILCLSHSNILDLFCQTRDSLYQSVDEMDLAVSSGLKRQKYEIQLPQGKVQ
jgi:hypothetical protein